MVIRQIYVCLQGRCHLLTFGTCSLSNAKYEAWERKDAL